MLVGDSFIATTATAKFTKSTQERVDLSVVLGTSHHIGRWRCIEGTIAFSFCFLIKLVVVAQGLNKVCLGADPMQNFKVIKDERWLNSKSFVKPVVTFIAKINASPVEISSLYRLFFGYLLPIAASLHSLNDLVRIVSFLHGVQMHLLGVELGAGLWRFREWNVHVCVVGGSCVRLRDLLIVRLLDNFARVMSQIMLI